MAGLRNILLFLIGVVVGVGATLLLRPGGQFPFHVDMPWRNLPAPSGNVDYWEYRGPELPYVLMKLDRQGRGHLVVLSRKEKMVYALTDVEAAAGRTSLVLVPADASESEMTMVCRVRGPEFRIEEIKPRPAWWPGGMLSLYHSPSIYHDPDGFREATRLMGD